MKNMKILVEVDKKKGLTDAVRLLSYTWGVIYNGSQELESINCETNSSKKYCNLSVNTTQEPDDIIGALSLVDGIRLVSYQDI